MSITSRDARERQRHQTIAITRRNQMFAEAARVLNEQPAVAAAASVADCLNEKTPVRGWWRAVEKLTGDDPVRGTADELNAGKMELLSAQAIGKLIETGKRLQVAGRQSPAPSAIKSEEPRSKQNASKRKRRHRQTGEPAKPLTAKQTEAMQLFGEHKGNIAAVARAMGVDYKTAQQHIEAAQAKLGVQVTKALTRAISTDARGQETIASDDDDLSVHPYGKGKKVQHDRR